MTIKHSCCRLLRQPESDRRPSAVGHQGTALVLVTNAACSSDPVTIGVQMVQPGFFLFSRNSAASVRLDGSYIGSGGYSPELQRLQRSRPGVLRLPPLLCIGAGLDQLNVVRRVQR